MNLKKIKDVHRKGDIVEGLTLGGLRQKGKFVEENEEGIKIQTNPNTFYILRKDTVVNEAATTRDEEASARRERRRIEHYRQRREFLYSRLDELDEEENRIMLDMEQDPEVLNDPDNGDNPAVIEYGERLTEIDNERSKIRKQLASIPILSENKDFGRMRDSEYEPGSPEYNREEFKKYWSPRNRKLNKNKTYYVAIGTLYHESAYKVEFYDGEWMYEYAPGDWAGLSDFYSSLTWWGEISKEEFDEMYKEDDTPMEEIDAWNQRNSW